MSESLPQRLGQRLKWAKQLDAPGMERCPCCTTSLPTADLPPTSVDGSPLNTSPRDSGSFLSPQFNSHFLVSSSFSGLPSSRLSPLSDIPTAGRIDLLYSNIKEKVNKNFFPSGTIFRDIFIGYSDSGQKFVFLILLPWRHRVYTVWSSVGGPGGRIGRIWGPDERDGSEWWRSWRWLLSFTILTFQSIFLENLSLYLV